MDLLEKNISQFVENQFPSVYRDEGPVFISFVKKYYEWLEESNNAIYHIRRLYEYKDIDDTIDEFVVYFKETYLKNIQLDTVQNTRQLVKHSLDLYRSKGTERSLALLFKIAFGVDIKVYYPINDLFTPSDGHWKIPQYMEVMLSEENGQFVGKQVRGIKSKATAFVETVVRRRSNTSLTDLFYISNVKGQFEAGESLIADGILFRPILFGSLNAIEVDQTGIGSGFSIGDILDVSSSSGTGATAKVTETANVSGSVTMDVLDGGYGFTVNSEVYISDVVVTIDVPTSNLILLETVYQPLANLHYVAANGYFTENTVLTSYHANGSIKGTGHILTVTESNTSSGRMLVEVLTGNLNANIVCSVSNTVGANLSLIDGYTDVTANGMVIGFRESGGDLKIGVANMTNTFYPGSYIYGTNSLFSGNVSAVSTGSGLDFDLNANSLTYTEEISYNNDQIKDYLNVAINAAAYGFPQAPSANSNSQISTTLEFVNTTFGHISMLTNINPGSLYNDIPFVWINEWKSTMYEKQNLTLSINNLTSVFRAGELINQDTTDARGLVLEANTTALVVQDYRVMNKFKRGFVITGETSNATANVTLVAAYTSNIVGNNAIIEADLTTANGAITGLKVLKSGFGFRDEQEVTLTYETQSLSGYANVYTIGSGEGYYSTRGSQPSDIKKLFDGDYWQQFSYDIISSLPFDKYQKMLRDVVHMAGYKPFGTWEHVQTATITDINVETIIE